MTYRYKIGDVVVLHTSRAANTSRRVYKVIGVPPSDSVHYQTYRVVDVKGKPHDYPSWKLCGLERARNIHRMMIDEANLAISRANIILQKTETDISEGYSMFPKI